MAKHIKHFETKLIHAGEPDPPIEGAVSMPIFQSSTFKYTGQASYHDLRYIRLNNTPNHRVLAENRLDDGFMASPAVSGDALYLRTKTALYRIEER